MQRCTWPGNDPLYLEYHDNQWGVPVHDDRLLFEMLCLEGAQAGLSWITILRKREGYLKAFKNFEPEVCAKIERCVPRKPSPRPGYCPKNCPTQDLVGPEECGGYAPGC